MRIDVTLVFTDVGDTALVLESLISLLTEYGCESYPPALEIRPERFAP